MYTIHLILSWTLSIWAIRDVFANQQLVQYVLLTTERFTCVTGNNLLVNDFLYLAAILLLCEPFTLHLLCCLCLHSVLDWVRRTIQSCVRHQCHYSDLFAGRFWYIFAQVILWHHNSWELQITPPKRCRNSQQCRWNNMTSYFQELGFQLDKQISFGFLHV